MNIGDVAARTGLPTKTIRYYEDIGLITPLRGENGYRRFREADMHKLGFVGRARALGFSIEECRDLLALMKTRIGPAPMCARSPSATLRRSSARSRR